MMITDSTALKERRALPVKWAKVLDQTLCIGCHACTTACKSENEVPLGVTRTYVKSVDIGLWPTTRRSFQVTRCNQCEEPPCVDACPTGAMFKREDGIVDFDKSICIGCKACMAACPYDAIFINPEDHSAEKCNFCAHRLEVGLEPACVVVCPTQAILIGDINDPTSKVSYIAQRTPIDVRRPEKQTLPKLYYRGAHHATLDPLAAAQPQGNTYAWSQIPKGPRVVNSGHSTGGHNSSAAAVLSYDIAHSQPWGWKVSLYTWTKSIAAGSYVVAILLAILGGFSWTSQVVRLDAPILALAFLSLTGVLLIVDLKHPMRFYLIFTHPQWKSWLVRGGFIIAGFGGIATLSLLGGYLHLISLEKVLSPLGIIFGVMTAVYTAYLFAQAKARDMWQSPLLPPHLAIQSILAGSAALEIVQSILHSGASSWLGTTVAVASGAQLLLVLGEITMRHPTVHAHQAVHAMIRGKYALWFWLSVILVAIGIATPALGGVGALLTLLGLLAYEHSFVQSAQSVPLA